jgi:hypothetical protein
MVAVDILDRQLETDRRMTYLKDAAVMFVHDKLSDIVFLVYSSHVSCLFDCVALMRA